MKRSFFVTFLLSIVAVFFCAPVCGTAFADDEQADEALAKITYYYNGEELRDTSVPVGTVLQEAPSYLTLRSLGLAQDELTGKVISVKLGSSDGADVTYPYTVNEDVSFYVVLTETDRTVKFSYRYNLNDVNEVTYPVGASVLPLRNVGESTVTRYFEDAALTRPTFPDTMAEEDRTYFLLLSKTVSFTLNGTTYSTIYGSSVRKATGTETHEYKAFYLDEEKTVPYKTDVALDDLVLYAKEEDLIRTHYAVTFVNKTAKLVVYVPLETDGTAIVDETYFPTDPGIAAVEWRIDEKKAPEYPYVITEDTTLYASNGMVYPLTKTDRAILHPVGLALVIMAVWGGIYEHRKSKKKKLQRAEEERKKFEESQRAEAAERSSETSESPAEQPETTEGSDPAGQTEEETDK